MGILKTLTTVLASGIDGVFLWGGGGRDCTATNCNGTGTCTAERCDAEASLGTYLNTLLGPAVQEAVTLAALCALATLPLWSLQKRPPPATGPPPALVELARAQGRAIVDLRDGLERTIGWFRGAVGL